MSCFLKASIAVSVIVWAGLFIVVNMACRSGTESDLSLLTAEVFNGIHNPIFYWTDKIAEQSLKGDLTARIQFLDISIRPQDCSTNETFPLGPDDVQIKLRENFEQGFKITPPVCPPPAVKQWCDEAVFGMRSVYLVLKGNQAIYPPDVTASYCCLETNRIGSLISQLRLNFGAFTLLSFILYCFVVAAYLSCCLLRDRIFKQWRRNRGRGVAGNDTEMEYMK